VDKVQGRIAKVQQVLSIQIGEIDQLESLAATNTESISQKVQRIGFAWDIKVLFTNRNKNKNVHNESAKTLGGTVDVAIHLEYMRVCLLCKA
jgi:hypothetical protein